MSMDGLMSSVVDGESNVGIESGSNGVVGDVVVVVGTENVGMVELGGGDGGVQRSVGGMDKEGDDGEEEVAKCEVEVRVSCEVERCGVDQEVDRSVRGKDKDEDIDMDENSGLVGLGGMTKFQVEVRVLCEAERCGIDQEVDRSVSGKDKEEDRDEDGGLVAFRVLCEVERCGLDQETGEGYSYKSGEKEGEGDGGSVGFEALPNSEVAFQVSYEGERDGIDQEVIRSVSSKGKDIDMDEDGVLVGCERLSKCERLGIDQEVDRSVSDKEEEEKGKEAGIVGTEEMANVEVRCSGENGSSGENGEVGLVPSRLIASRSRCAEQKEKLLVGRQENGNAIPKEERGNVRGNGETALVLSMPLTSSSMCAHQKEEKEEFLFDRRENGTAVSEVPEDVSELRCSRMVFNRIDTLSKTGNPLSLIYGMNSLVQNGEACFSMSECTQEEQQMVDGSDDMVFNKRADYELGSSGITELSSSGKIEGHCVEIEESQSAAQNCKTPQILSSSSVSSSECTKQQQQATIGPNTSMVPLESNQLCKLGLGSSVLCDNPTGKAIFSETTSKVEQNVEQAPVLLVDFRSDCFQSHADAAVHKLFDSSGKTVYSPGEVEEKNAGLDENVNELMSQKLNIKEIPSIVSEEVCTTAYDRVTEISASIQLAHLQDAFSVRPSGHINSNLTSSSRKRSTRRSKLNQINETQKTSKQQSKNSIRSKRVSRETLKPLLKPTKRKRSCPCKPARSSIWGELRNIVSGFTESNAVLEHDSPNFPVDNLRDSKFRSTRQSRGGQKTQAYGTSKCQPWTSSGKFTTKVKMARKKTYFYHSDTTDSSASDTTDFSEDEFLPEDHIDVEVCNLPKCNMRDDAQGNWEKRATSPFTSNRDKETVTQHYNIGNSLGDRPCDSVVLKSKVFEREAVNNQYSDQGTSPDSEVIDVIHDIADGTLVKKDLHDVTASSSAVGLVGFTTSTVELKSSKKGNKPGNANHVSPRCRHTRALGCNLSESFGLSVKENSFSSSSIVVGLPYTPSPKSKILNVEEPRKSENSECINSFAVPDIGVKRLELVSTEGLTMACNDLQSSKASMSCPETSVHRLFTPSLSAHTVRDTHERKLDDKKKAVYRRKPKDKVSMVQAVSCVDDNLEKNKDIHFSSQAVNLLELRVPTELTTISFSGLDTFDFKKSSTSGTLSDEISSTTLTEFNNQNLAPRKAWVLCDDCSKWRSISAVLADSIDETNCKWTCKENLDTAFADCSIPQEKTNSEINAELDISDASGDEDALAKCISSNSECKSLTVFEQSSWKSIKSNLFLHRSRKSTPDDEIMVCQCTPPRDGGLGCGDECLNRMLNIECVQGTCPCGDQCSNQQFQKRKYAKLNYFRCGRKGHGLQVLERISPGKFLIEYVGEVLDMTAYGERQREYAFRGQKHFYFMTLTATEIIDACAKGNLGRFINHSCDPNCRTEKWMVNGEVCIGLFALRSIKEGEELTFDYNYQRVFGAAAKKCICGAPECRGYLGGDPSNTEIVVQSESDDEYPEPLMVLEAGDDSFHKTIVQSGESMIPTPLCIDPPELPLLTLQTEDTMTKEFSLIELPESLPTDDIIGDLLFSEQPLEVSPPNDELMNKSFPIIPFSSTFFDHTAAMTKSLSHPVAAKTNLLSSYADNKFTISKKRPLKKSLRLSNSVKKTRISPVKAIKPWVHVTTPKKIVEEVAGSRFEGVEEKLSEFLGTDGGISRRKGQDVTKGYLKLLFVTATSGDNINSESMQRTRDLSILLDALLKTKSRTVLADLISKHGLQILHNLIKQNRKIFNRTPIIRKLLKVFEFLAQEGILTSDHINCPPRVEAESFAESILELTSHTDVPVHSSARTFRDKWISQAVRRLIYLKKDDNFMLEQPKIGPSSKQLSSAFRSLNQGLQPTTPHLNANGTTTRKRKSRWDQPTDVIMHPHSYEGIESQKMHKTRIEVSPCAHKDAPPGFSCPQETLPVSVANDLVTGCPQERYISDQPMSYGIPLSFVNQLGCEAEITNSWLVAPAIPFHLFPPLPSVPRYTSPADGPHQMETSLPSTSESTQVLQESVANSASSNQPIAESNIGRRYFRQQKLNNNNWNSIPPWCRRRNWEGYKGNNSFRDQNVGFVPNNFRGSFGRGRGQYFNSNFYQQPRYYR